MVACDETGLPVFDLLRGGARASLYAFDLLELDGAELRREPIELRKVALGRLIGADGPSLLLSQPIDAVAADAFAHIRKLAWRAWFRSALRRTRRDVSGRAYSGPVGIRWWHSYFDEEIASGIITADMGNAQEGWLRIQIGSLDQRVILILISRPLNLPPAGNTTEQGTKPHIICSIASL